MNGITGDEDPVLLHSGNELAKLKGYNTNLAYSSPSPVDAPPIASKGPFSDALGNVWEWAEDDFHPLPGTSSKQQIWTAPS